MDDKELREKPPIKVLNGIYGRGRDLEAIQLAQREADIKYFQPKIEEARRQGYEDGIRRAMEQMGIK